jgi:hypothetical protein
MIARSRLPFSVSPFGDQRARASVADSQFPSRIPSFFTPLTRRMPAVSSGLGRPASANSYGKRRTAASLTLIPEAKFLDSRWFRYRNKTVLLKENRSSEQYHSMNSSIACRYPRCNSGERRFPSTAVQPPSTDPYPAGPISLSVERTSSCLSFFSYQPPPNGWL